MLRFQALTITSTSCANKSPSIRDTSILLDEKQASAAFAGRPLLRSRFAQIERCQGHAACRAITFVGLRYCPAAKALGGLVVFAKCGLIELRRDNFAVLACWFQ